MALNLMPAIEMLQKKLEELKAQGLYYAGEFVFASDDPSWNKIDPLSFHLYDVRHADALDRIVMLFTDQAVSKAAILNLEYPLAFIRLTILLGKYFGFSVSLRTAYVLSKSWASGESLRINSITWSA